MLMLVLWLSMAADLLTSVVEALIPCKFRLNIGSFDLLNATGPSRSGFVDSVLP